MQLLKYKYTTLALLMALVSLFIWYYILRNADGTAYPPLSIILNFNKIPDWVMGLHFFTGALCILFLVLNFFSREGSKWVSGVILIAVVFIYFRLTICFTTI